MTGTNTIKNLKLTLKLGMSMKNFLVIVEYYISLERSRKVLFNGNVFENVDWNYYHLKPQTWYVNEKIFNNYDILYILEKDMKNAIQW